MDNALMKKACQLSKDAYGLPNGCTVVKVRTAKAIMVKGQDGCIWIAVEGTRPKIKDWLKNFWTKQTDFFGLEVHSGCAREAELLFPLKIEELKAYDIKPTLLLTGHSQGGGVAPLLAWALEGKDYFVKAGFGFAPMRSIEKGSCKIFNAVFLDRWWSIARQSDIVPHAPPAKRYGDTGHGKFFNWKGKLVDGIPTPREYLSEVFRLIRKWKLSETWKDHSIDKYIKDVNNI